MDEDALHRALSRLEEAIGLVAEPLRKDLLLDARALRLESFRPTLLRPRALARVRELARRPELSAACAELERVLG